MRNSNSLEKSLRIAPEQNDSDEDSDSDGLIPGMPEIPGLEGVEKSKHLNFAAINLLLALLQGMVLCIASLSSLILLDKSQRLPILFLRMSPC